MEYRVDVGIKNMEQREKTNILDIFGSCTHSRCTGTPFLNPKCTGTL